MWKKSIDAPELMSYQKNWRSRLQPPGIRENSNPTSTVMTAPDTSFAPTEATLEDVYFMKLNRTPVGAVYDRARPVNEKWLGGHRPPLQ